MARAPGEDAPQVGGPREDTWGSPRWSCEEVAGEREHWASLLSLLPLRPDKPIKMGGYSVYFVIASKINISNYTKYI